MQPHTRVLQRLLRLRRIPQFRHGSPTACPHGVATTDAQADILYATRWGFAMRLCSRTAG